MSAVTPRHRPRRYILIIVAGVALGAGSGCATGLNEGIGAVLGGAIAGAAASNIGEGRANVAATVAGTLIGAAIGGRIGKAIDDVDALQAEQVLETTPTGQTRQWQNPDSGAQFAMTPIETYQRGTAPCREYEMVARIDGQREVIYGTACRGPDGRWISQ